MNLLLNLHIWEFLDISSVQNIKVSTICSCFAHLQNNETGERDFNLLFPQRIFTHIVFILNALPIIKKILHRVFSLQNDWKYLYILLCNSDLQYFGNINIKGMEGGKLKACPDPRIYKNV